MQQTLGEEAIWALNKVSDHLQKYSSAQTYLFGSRANNTHHRHSDIDIAIDIGKPVPLELMAEINEALAQSHLLVEVDLVDLNLSDKVLKSKILSEGLLWND